MGGNLQLSAVFNLPWLALSRASCSSLLVPLAVHCALRPVASLSWLWSREICHFLFCFSFLFQNPRELQASSAGLETVQIEMIFPLASSQPRMPTAEEIYHRLLEIADENDAADLDEKVICTYCGKEAMKKYPSRYDLREQLDQALWSHASSCPGCAKRAKLSPPGGGGGGGGGGDDKKVAKALEMLDTAQTMIDQAKDILAR